jgi:hypothetical protein
MMTTFFDDPTNEAYFVRLISDKFTVPEIIAAIVDASDDALEPFPLPVPPNPNDLETWSDVIDSPATKE